MNISLREEIGTKFFSFYLTQADEFHHAAAPSYQSLLNYFKPKILLGLTATPERADGESIFKYFDNPEAIQLRLTEAIDQKLLCPFHYFGVTDSVDFRKVRWSAGKYNVEDLENLLVLNDIVSKRRAEQVKKAIENYALAWDEIIGIGFCVSKKHAAFMAAYFNESGIPSECLTSDSDASLREIVKQKLIAKEIHFVFVVDLYNEGVDIPEVNTVLFLRPTESLTIFLQQLGRGLRLATGKEALTVIDFVGHQNVNYDFESRFRAVIKKTRRSVSQEIEDGFVHVPKGCSILLEKVAQKTILNHIASAVNSKKQIIRKLNDWKNSSDSNDYLDFYQHWHVKPLEVYRINQKKATLSGLINANESSTEMDQILAKGFARLSQVRAVSWLKWLIENLPAIAQNNFDIYSVIETDDTVSMRWLDMLYYTFYTDSIDTSQITLSEVLKYLFGRSTYFDELMTIIRYAYNHIDYNTYLLDEDNGNLELHAVYTVNMVLSALGKHNFGKRYPFREGVLYLSEQELDVFFITLNKSESDYSETTLYDDYAISEKLFHWQSQSRTSVSSSTGIRYVTQRGSGRKILLFARPYKSEDGYTSLYTCLGYADYVSHEGSSPINIVWELYDRIPGHLLNLALKAE